MSHKALIRKIIIGLGYFLVAAAIIILTAGLVAYGQGYTYDFKTGKISRNGLVILQSSPSGAEVYHDGKDLKNKTDFHQLYPSGDQSFMLAKSGFLPWAKTLTVVPGEASMVQYAILMPDAVKKTVLDEQVAILAESANKDHSRLAYVVGGEQAGVYVLDTGGSARRVFVAPTPEKDKPQEVLESVSWSDDSSHLLVVSRAGDARVYRVMSNSGGDVVNLTDQYHFDFSSLAFSRDNWQKLYWLSSAGDLRRLDLGAKTVSGVLADKVTQFNALGGHLLYVRVDTTGYSLWDLGSGDKPKTVISALAPSPKYSLAYVSWQNQDELAVVPTATRVGLLYTGVFGSTPTTQTIAGDVDRASFSPDGHLLVFYDSNKAVTYDLEKTDVLKVRTTYLFPKVAALHELTWFDNFHVIMNMGGRLVWSEFDGQNAHDLGSAYAEFAAYGTTDERSVVGLFDFGVGRVQATRLLLKP